MTATADPGPAELSITLAAPDGMGRPNVIIDARIHPDGIGGTLELYDGATLIQTWPNYATRGGFNVYGLTQGMHPLIARFDPAVGDLSPVVSNEIDYTVGAEPATVPAAPSPTATSTATAVMIVPLPTPAAPTTVAGTPTPAPSPNRTRPAIHPPSVAAAGVTTSHASTLPFTGANVLVLAWVGGVLIALGTALRIGAGRRWGNAGRTNSEGPLAHAS